MKKSFENEKQGNACEENNNPFEGVLDEMKENISRRVARVLPGVDHDIRSFTAKSMKCHHYHK
jgi:hypothetical protein